MRLRTTSFAAAAITLVLGAAAAGAAPATRAYLTRGDRLQIVERPARAGIDRHVLAVRALLAGPTAAERRDGVGTAVPRTARLIAFQVVGSVGYVRVSDPFGIGTPRALRRRRIQLVYTLTQFADVRAVRILIGAEPEPVPGTDPPESLLSRASFPRRVVVGPIPIGVADVQRRLVALRYLPAGGVTGRLDYRTAQALLAFQGWERIPRDGVAAFRTRERLSRAAPPAPAGAGTGRRMEVDRAKGVLLLVDGRRVVRAIHVSTGVGGRTPRGSFGIIWKARMSWSRPFRVWMPWASYFTGGYAFHEYPIVPAYPASHGCIRIGRPEARGVYDFAALGTPVAIR